MKDKKKSKNNIAIGTTTGMLLGQLIFSQIDCGIESYVSAPMGFVSEYSNRVYKR